METVPWAVGDVLWNLPFSSDRQAGIVRQQFPFAKNEWVRHRKLIMQEHCQPGAREQLSESDSERWMSQVSSASFQTKPAQGLGAGPATTATVDLTDVEAVSACVR